MQGAKEIPIAGLSMEELFDNYFEHHAPFEDKEKKKSEFPDAVMIMSIKQFLEQGDSQDIHIVTDDKGWHNALHEQKGVVLYHDIKELLTEIAKDEDVLYQEIAQYMGESTKSLENAACGWLKNQDWSSTVDNIEMCIECDEVDDVYVSSIKLVPDGVQYIDSKNGYAIAMFSGIAKVHLDFMYIDHQNEIYDREDHIWINTIHGEGTAEISVPFSGSATVFISDNGVIKRTEPEIDEIIVEEIQLDEIELNPKHEMDDPFFNICPDCGCAIGIHNDGGNGFCVDCAMNH